MDCREALRHQSRSGSTDSAFCVLLRALESCASLITSNRMGPQGDGEATEAAATTVG
jgi:hypothetical protein